MKIRLLIVCLLAMVIIGPVSADMKKVNYPKLAIYSTSPVFSMNIVERYAKFDLVILDMENWTNNPDSIKKLRERNPDIIILAYANPMEVYYKKMPNRHLMWQLYNTVKEKKAKETSYSDWFFWTTKREHVIFYAKLPLWMMNMSVDCRKVKGYRWNTYITDFLINNVLTRDPQPDGYFMDNSTADIHWLNHTYLKTKKVGWIDSDLNGKADKGKKLDSAWKAGQKEHVAIIRKKFGRDFLIVGNKGKTEYKGIFDGKMFEEFPYIYAGPDKRAGGWFECMRHYAKTGPYSIIQIVQTADEKFVTFGLASTLLGDGYFAINHNNSKWWSVYDRAKKLGQPKEKIERCEYGEKALPGAAKIKGKKYDRDSFWKREFENGSVTVWPFQRKGEIAINR